MLPPPYAWKCLACGESNGAATDTCTSCGCAACATEVQIKHARQQLLRSQTAVTSTFSHSALVNQVTPRSQSNFNYLPDVLATLHAFGPMLILRASSPVSSSIPGFLAIFLLLSWPIWLFALAKQRERPNWMLVPLALGVASLLATVPLFLFVVGMALGGKM